jgi:small-conductance mechanosensitive channel
MSSTIIAITIRVGLSISLTLLAYLIISRLIESYGKKHELEKRQIRQVKTFFKYIMLIFGAIALTYAIGLDPAVLLAGAGIAGFTISFAAKDLISNLLAGLFLIFGRNFAVSDVVKIGDIYGIVRLISIRITEIRTFDGNIVSVPNSTVVNSNIINMTSGSKFMLTSIIVRVGIDEDLNKVSALMERAVPKDEHIHIESKSDIFFEFQEIQDEGIVGNKVIMYFKVDAHHEPWVRSKVQAQIVEALTREKINFQRRAGS